MMMMMMMMIEFGQGTEIVTRAAQFMELSMKKDERVYMVSTLPWEILLAFSIPYCQSPSPQC